jgi:hypothetical protein
MQIDIGMKRKRWAQVVEQLQAQLQNGSGNVDISLYTEDGEVHLTSEDMEHDEVDVSEVYVDITE